MEISTNAVDRFPGGVIPGAAQQSLLKSLVPLNGPNDERRKT
jgi:hypothetical protein